MNRIHLLHLGRLILLIVKDARMDAYPPEYVATCLPLFVLSGVGIEDSPRHSLQTNGPCVGTDTVQVQSARGKKLIQGFLELESNEASAQNVESETLRVSFRVARAVSRYDSSKADYNLIVPAIPFACAKSQPSGLYGGPFSGCPTSLFICPTKGFIFTPVTLVSGC